VGASSICFQVDQSGIVVEVVQPCEKEMLEKKPDIDAC